MTTAQTAPGTAQSVRLTWGAGMPLRGDRIRTYVNAFCPQCHAQGEGLDQVQRLSGWLAERDGRVYLERGCPSHGFIRTLYDESPEILDWLERWTAPTKWHVPDTPGNFDPVPLAFARGLPEMHTQHTCILLADLLDECNLRCPTCFADSAPAAAGIVPVADILANVDARLARENGRLDVVMLSGGEPTLYPQFAQLLDALVSRDIVRIMVNTNGLRIATDDALLDLLAKHRTRAEVYLQFDGVSERAHRYHRGGDLRAQKLAAIERLASRGVFTTLTMTAALGVNDNEIGDVIQIALATPFVGGVSIQPVFGSGRGGQVDPMDRLTHTGVLARLAGQTDGLVEWDDLTALPCSHPHCCSVGYMIRTDSGEWRSLVAIIGADQLAANLDLVANRIADREIPKQLRAAVKNSLLDLLSERTSLTHPDTGRIWSDICTACDLGLSTLMRAAASALPGREEVLRQMLAERIVRITVKPFMDIHTMIEPRLTQCCVHVGTRAESGDQCAPFCAVQAWPALSQQRLPRTAGAGHTLGRF